MGSSSSKERLTILHNNPEDFYKKQELIGKGSFGIVYKVKEIKTKFVYAAKIISYNEFTDNPSISEELVINSMIKCPFITRFYNAFDFEEKNEIWILFEFCDYGTVGDLIRCYTLPEPIIARIIRDVLLALTYLHYSDEIIIHRDIKASNILLKSKGRVKLSDFGVSTRLARQHSIVNNFAGTLSSIPPEIYKGDGISTKSDIWSIGILCIELCEGRPPFSGLTKDQIASIMNKNTIIGLSHPQNYSKELNDFIYLCLQPSATFRPSARRLLMHPFLVTAVPDSYLSSYLAKHPIYKYNRTTIDYSSSICSFSLTASTFTENDFLQTYRMIENVHPLARRIVGLFPCLRLFYKCICPNQKPNMSIPLRIQQHPLQADRRQLCRFLHPSPLLIQPNSRLNRRTLRSTPTNQIRT